MTRSPAAAAPSSRPPAEPLGSEARWALLGLSLAILLAQLGATVANVGLPTLMQAFHASFAVVQWVVVSYLLSVTALIVSVSRIADLWGRRRAFVAGIVVFTAASALCAAAPGVWWLVGARALQGLGAAVMLSLTMAFVGDVVPRARAGSAMGLLSTMQSAATTLAPSLGGLAIACIGWRAMFWLNVPLGIAAAWVVLRHIPDSPPAQRPRFDMPGTVLLVGSLCAYCFAMTEAQAGGFGAPRTLALLAAAAAGLAGFVAWERRAASPLVRFELFAGLPFSASMAMTVLVTTVMMSTLTLGPFYLSHALHLPTSQVGLVMSIGPLFAALSGIPSGRIVDRFGARPTMIVGLVVLTAGSLAMALLAPLLSVAGYVVAIALICVGYAFFQTPNNTAVMAEAPGDQRATVSGLLNLSRNLGLVSGASVMGSLFAAASGLTVHHAGEASAAVIAGGMRDSFLVATALVAASLALGLLSLRTRAPAAHGAPARG